MDAASMLEVYRRDRRRLLGFLLSAGGGGGRALDLSRVDLDAVVADYALECVASVLPKETSAVTNLIRSPPTGFQADTIIVMLINASDQTPHNPEATNARRRHVHVANTLIRVLCHEKDKIASTFLRIQYHLPRSSDYDDVPVKDVSSKLPIFSDMLKRGTSFNWSETGQQSFRIMKKLQEATRQY